MKIRQQLTGFVALGFPCLGIGSAPGPPPATDAPETLLVSGLVPSRWRFLGTHWGVAHIYAKNEIGSLLRAGL